MTRVFAALVVVAAGSCAAPPSPLVVRAPSRVQDAVTSDDDDLCARLAVDLTFDRADDLDAPPIDRARLVADDDSTCTWALAEPAQLRRGTYDLLVRFLAADDAIDAAACGGDDVWIGAFRKDGIAFPFVDFGGLTDDDFASRPGEEDRVGVAGVDFDRDGDGADNLAETARGANPCVVTAPPAVSLDATPTPPVEGQPTTIVVASEDPDGAQHRVRVTIAHGNGPNLGVDVVSFEGDSDDVDAWTIRADDGPVPADAPWSLQVAEATSVAPGAARWTLTFTAQEPFVGATTITAQATDDEGAALGDAVAVGVDVQNVVDPTVLLFDVDGVDVPRSQLAFREVGDGVAATAQRFRLANDELGVDTSTWAPRVVSAPAGLTMTADGAYWRLTWSPGNEEALRPPAGGHQLVLEFDDVAAGTTTQQTYPVVVSPLYNDAPTFAAPNPGELALPKGAFTAHLVHFIVQDVDETEDAPTCAAVVAPAGSTTCTAPFSLVRCEPIGVRVGAARTYELRLEPAGTYAACGAAPSFAVEVTITDVPPPGAEPATPKSASTSSSCADAACVPTFALRTAEVVTGAIVSGGAGDVPSYTGASRVAVDGVLKRGFATVLDPSFDMIPVVVDLAPPAPSFLHRFPVDAICDTSDEVRTPFVVDEVNHRVAWNTFMAPPGQTCADAERAVAVVDLESYAITSYLLADICPSCPYFGCPGNPVVAPSGDLFVPCGREPGQLARIDPAGTATTKGVAGYVDPGGASDNEEAAVVVDAAAKPWLVWPDSDGILLVDLTTYDGTLATTRLAGTPVAFDPDDVDGHFVDVERKAYVYAVTTDGSTNAAELWRVSFAGASPALQGPLALGDVGANSSNGSVYMRLVPRPPTPGAPAALADLVITGGASQVRPHVDLDAFALTTTRPLTDWYFGGASALLPSPDRRYFLAPTPSSYEDDLPGAYLYPWDATLPRLFVEVPLPTYGALQTDGDDATSSGTGDLITIANGDGRITVLHFVEAAAGLD